MDTYNTLKINDYITCIEDDFVRMFLVEGETEAMLVDTGFGKKDLAGFVKTLTDKPVFVVNTHADRDHIGANNQFDDIYMHTAEFDRYYSSFDVKNDPNPLFEGDEFDLGTSVWSVILTPGHTPGSIMLYDNTSKILIAGDSIQYGPIFMFGPGRNIPAYIASLEMLSEMNLEISKILPSHNGMELPKNIIDMCINAAEQVFEGSTTGTPVEHMNTYLHKCGEISFYYGNKE